MEDKNRYMEVDPEASIQQNRKTVKLDSSRSQFVKKAQTEEEFSKKVDSFQSNQVEKNQRAAELAKDFWDLIKSTELTKTKGPILKNREKEIISNLILYGRELNNDPPQNADGSVEDGVGSIAIITLLMKSILHHRDLCNELEYRLSEAEKQIKKLSSHGKSDDIKK